VVIAMLFCLAAQAPTARAEDLDPAKVKKSIDQAINYLQNKQNADGSWPTWRQYDLTSLCTLALLNAGVDPQSEPIQRALNVLRNPARQPSSTYLVSLQTMVLCAAEPKKDQLLIRRNVNWLEEQQINSGSMKGAWGYPVGK
jgi:squalene cyclase